MLGSGFGTVSGQGLQSAIFLLSVIYSELILCVFNLKITVAKSGVRVPSTRAPDIYQFDVVIFLRFK